MLLIENGPDDRPQRLVVDMPKGFGKLLADTKMAYHFVTAFLKPQGVAPDIWVRGKTLGGSSSVNGMVWMRGQPEDYDRLAALGNPGWGWSDILPYLKRLENHELGASDTRGVGGPIDITTHPEKSRLCEAMIAAGEAMGLPRKLDQNQRGSRRRGLHSVQHHQAPAARQRGTRVPGSNPGQTAKLAHRHGHSCQQCCF